MWDGMDEASTERILQRRLDKAERYLPGILGERVAHLRRPSASWLRVPLGVLLVLGGLLSILPVLGIWMLPLGLVLLALHVALLSGRRRACSSSNERLWNRFARAGKRDDSSSRSPRVLA